MSPAWRGVRKYVFRLYLLGFELPIHYNNLSVDFDVIKAILGLLLNEGNLQDSSVSLRLVDLVLRLSIRANQ